MNESVARELASLALALAVARQMVRRALKVRPELVLPVIEEALASLPRMTQPCQLILHPEDAALVCAHLAQDLAASNWVLRQDTRVERGGCRVETASGDVDATLETRWQRIVPNLAQNATWLE